MKIDRTTMYHQRTPYNFPVDHHPCDVVITPVTHVNSNGDLEVVEQCQVFDPVEYLKAYPPHYTKIEFMQEHGTLDLNDIRTLRASGPVDPRDVASYVESVLLNNKKPLENES